MQREYVVVAGQDEVGIQTISVHIVNVTEAQYEMGAHKDMAIFEAEELGYTGPFKCYDNSEHSIFIAAATELKRMKEEGYIK